MRNRLHRPRVVESHYVEVRNPYTNKLIFEYDPVRNVVRHQDKGRRCVIDLNEFIISNVNCPLVDIEHTS